MEGMIGEFEIAIEDTSETADARLSQPAVYIEETPPTSASEGGDGAVFESEGQDAGADPKGGFCIDHDGRNGVTDDAEPAAARTKADLLPESLGLAGEQSADSFDFVAPETQAGGDLDAPDLNEGEGIAILVGLLLPAIADDGGADAQTDDATGMAPLTTQSDFVFVAGLDGTDGEFSVGLLDPSL